MIPVARRNSPMNCGVSRCRFSLQRVRKVGLFADDDDDVPLSGCMTGSSDCCIVWVVREDVIRNESGRGQRAVGYVGLESFSAMVCAKESCFGKCCDLLRAQGTD